MSKDLRAAIGTLAIGLLIAGTGWYGWKSVSNQYADDPIKTIPNDPKTPTADCRGWALMSTTGCCCSPEGLWLNLQGRSVEGVTCTQSETDKKLCPSAFPRHRNCVWHGNWRSCPDDYPLIDLGESRRKTGL